MSVVVGSITPQAQRPPEAPAVKQFEEASVRPCDPDNLPPTPEGARGGGARGRASGGIVNTVTRSGSNLPYGTAYWFFRNQALNARDPHSTINPPERRHQAGASVGGKMVRDKLFFFFNGEAHRRDFPLVASLGRRATAAMRGRL